MVIKLYISGISGNKEVKKKQQRVQMILDSKQISYEAIDITEPGKEKDKEFMQQNGKVRESLGKHPLPPQIFNDDNFCGDYEDFDMANEVDELEKFLHIETTSKDTETNSKQDEVTRSFTRKFTLSKQHSVNSIFNPYEYHTFKIRYNSVNGLQEQIFKTKDLAGENEQNEEVTKTEINGETQAVPSLNPSFENISANVDISTEEDALEKEESSAVENKINDDSGKKKTEGNLEDNEKQEIKEAEKEEEKEENENPEESKVENVDEEKSPHLEESEENNDADKDKERYESEEENESGNESPLSKKSQEE